MLIHRDEIKELQKIRNKENEKIIDEIVDYFNKWVGVGYNTVNLVYFPDELAEKYELLIEKNDFKYEFNEGLTSDDIQDLIYLVDRRLDEIKESIYSSFLRTWKYEELKRNYQRFFILRKKLLKVS